MYKNKIKNVKVVKKYMVLNFFFYGFKLHGRPR